VNPYVMVSEYSDVWAIADSARTTQLLQAAFNVIDATLAGHRHCEYCFKDWDRHFGKEIFDVKSKGLSKFGSA
jgi:hypothetical protein